jgi:hypothetical protein
MTPLIESKIAAVQRKHSLVAVGTGAAMVVGTVLLVTGLTMLIDWWFELPWVGRALSLALNLSAAVYLVVRFIVLPIVYGPDDEQVGLWVEEKEPAFESRLITAIQLTREGALQPGASRPMLGAVVRQAEAIAQPLDFGRVVSTDRMFQFMGVAVLVVLLSLIALAVGGRDVSDLLKRAMLVPGVEVPRKTRVVLESPEEMVVARGDDVVLSARAEGVVPDHGQVRIRYESGREQEIEIQPADAEKDDALFSRTIPNVQESFTYTVHLYDGRSREQRVRAELRPAVAGVEVQQIFPAYTGLPPMKRSTGDLSILEGSRLVVRIKANKPVKATTPQDKDRNFIHLIGPDLRLPLEVDPSDPTQLIAVERDQRSIPVPKLPEPTTGFSVQLVDEHGLISKDPAVYRVDLLPDRAPNVRITFPTRKEELATARASMVIGFDASDDFALGQARIRYTTRSPDEQRAEGDGLQAEYFAAQGFKGQRVERIDPVLNFERTENKPHEQIGPHNFSARWSGVLVPTESGSYTFLADFDDAVRVVIDERMIIDRWPDGAHDKTLKGGPISLEAGKPYPIRVEFQQGVGPWGAKLRWKLGNGPERVVPTTVLFRSQAHFEQTQRKDQPPIQLNLGGTPKSIRGHFNWDLSKLENRLPVGTLVEWWVEVEDTNNISGPGVAASERYLARIVTEDEKRAELMMRLGDAWNPIDSIAEDQRQLNEDLGQLVQEQLKSK